MKALIRGVERGVIQLSLATCGVIAGVVWGSIIAACAIGAMHWLGIRAGY